MKITAADVAKLRKMTGAGMMDCKSALEEAKGDFEMAKDIIRKKGQLVANKRSDREASEGVVVARIVGETAYMAALACETDFVAINEGFIASANEVMDIAVKVKSKDIESLLAEKMSDVTVAEAILDKSGQTGEKIELAYYAKIEAPMCIFYVHSNKKLGAMIGFSKKISEEVAYDIAMQAAAMAPVSISEEDFPADVLAKEREIGREQARLEGKPEAMLDKIADGKVRKFLSENTLMNQSFVKDPKMTVGQYLQNEDKEVKIIAYKRFALG